VSVTDQRSVVQEVSELDNRTYNTTSERLIVHLKNSRLRFRLLVFPGGFCG